MSVARVHKGQTLRKTLRVLMRRHYQQLNRAAESVSLCVIFCLAVTHMQVGPQSYGMMVAFLQVVLLPGNLPLSLSLNLRSHETSNNCMGEEER